MIYHTEPKCGSLAEVAGMHLVFIRHILLEDGKSAGVLQCEVKGLTNTGLDEIEQGIGVGNLSVLLLNESLN